MKLQVHGSQFHLLLYYDEQHNIYEFHTQQSSLGNSFLDTNLFKYNWTEKLINYELINEDIL